MYSCPYMKARTAPQQPQPSPPTRREYFLDDSVSGKIYDSVQFWRLFQYVRPYWKTLTVSIIALLTATVANTVGPLFTKYVVDTSIPNQDLAGLRWAIIAYAVLTFAEMIFTFVQTYLFQYLGQKVMHDLRLDIFQHLQKLTLPFFDRNPVGRLMTRVLNDVSTVNEMFTSGFITIITDFLIIAGITGVMMWADWRMALLLFSIVPVMLFFTFEFRRRVRDAYRDIRARLAALNAYLQENIQGMREVHLFNRQQRNAERFEQLNQRHMSSMFEVVWNFAVYYPVMEMLSAVGLAIIIWYGGRSVLNESMTFGSILLFTKYSKKFWQPIMNLSEKYQILQSSMASLERIFKLLDAKAFLLKQGELPEPEVLRGEIEFRKVWFAYEGEDWVLRDVSFHVRPGQSLAVVGATGSGKSTVIKLISRLYEFQRGEILIDGRDIRTYSPEWLRSRMGTVLQDVFLFAGDVHANITLGNPGVSHEQAEAAARAVHADEFIQALPSGYSTNLKERGAILSTGQKQLLAFARALAHDPDVLILDEATANIDTEHELLIQEAVSKLQKDRTSIVIAHRLSTIVHSDLILLLHKGQVREVGTHQELLALKGLYAMLYELQFEHNGATPVAEASASAAS